jgi:bifunctional ADP-heptose synthase (sugar kinase/adenylyltransferase)
MLRPDAHRTHQTPASGTGDGRRAHRYGDRRRAREQGRRAARLTEQERAESLAALACVDFVAINREPTATTAIRLLRPDYYVKGQVAEAPGGRSAKLQREIETVRAVGGDVRFTHEVVFSSTALLKAHFGVPPGRMSP